MQLGGYICFFFFLAARIAKRARRTFRAVSR